MDFKSLCLVIFVASLIFQFSESIYRADIILSIDISYSVGIKGLQQQTTFLSNVSKALFENILDLRVSYFSFSSYTDLHFSFLSSSKDASEQILKSPLYIGGGSYVDRSIRFALELFEDDWNKIRERKCSTKVFILLVGGYIPYSSRVNKIQFGGIKVFAVGINLSQSEKKFLAKLVGSTTYFVDDFDELPSAQDNIINNVLSIENGICCSKSLPNGMVESSCRAQIGDVCGIVCDEGYDVISDVDSITCRSDNTWSIDENILCQKKAECTRKSLSNGIIEPSCRGQIGDNCTIICDEGYGVISGVDSVMCRPDNIWSMDESVLCQKKADKEIFCNKSLSNGMIDPLCQAQMGDNCTVLCDEGYDVISGVESIICRSDRTWSIDENTICQEKPVITGFQFQFESAGIGFGAALLICGIILIILLLTRRQRRRSKVKMKNEVKPDTTPRKAGAKENSYKLNTLTSASALRDDDDSNCNQRKENTTRNGLSTTDFEEDDDYEQIDNNCLNDAHKWKFVANQCQSHTKQMALNKTTDSEIEQDDYENVGDVYENC